MDNIHTRTNDAAKDYEWSIKASCHNYVELYYYGKFIRCLDNCLDYGDEIIAYIEKRTHKKINELPLVECTVDDFSGFRFLGKGFLNLLTGKK